VILGRLPPFAAIGALPPLRSGQVFLDEAEHFLHNRTASVATLRELFAFGPECRSRSLRNQRSSSPESSPTVIAAPDSTTSPLKMHGPGSNLADSTLLEVTANGELILAGGAGNGYRFAELGAANNPSGWSGVLKVKTPAGATLGYVLLYTNP
jgi:hypothetical protein